LVFWQLRYALLVLRSGICAKDGCALRYAIFIGGGRHKNVDITYGMRENIHTKKQKIA